MIIHFQIGDELELYCYDCLKKTMQKLFCTPTIIKEGSLLLSSICDCGCINIETMEIDDGELFDDVEGED